MIEWVALALIPAARGTRIGGYFFKKGEGSQRLEGVWVGRGQVQVFPRCFGAQGDVGVMGRTRDETDASPQTNLIWVLDTEGQSICHGCLTQASSQAL